MGSSIDSQMGSSMGVQRILGSVFKRLSDGLLSGEVLARFEKHRNECQHCAGYASKYLDTIRLGRSACQRINDEMPNQQVPEHLIRRILDVQSGNEFLT